MKRMLASKMVWLALLLLAALAGIACWQRESIIAWHAVRQLANASPDEREARAQAVAGLGEAAIPRMLARLSDPDPAVCSNLHLALVLLGKQWGPADERSHELVERIHAQFRGFSVAGQEQSLYFLAMLLREDGPRPLPVRLTKTIGEVLVHSEQKSELRAAALLVAGELVERVQPGQWVEACREMAQRGIEETQPATRVAALQLLSREPMRNEVELLEKAVPLLADKDAAVRRSAVIVLASATEIVNEEALLPLLHDEDLQVQDYCETALRKRGLTDDDLILARLISDRDPAKRVRVLHHFYQRPDLNLAAWLRRLSADPVASVRAAAVRAAADFPAIDFSERMREMAERDPSEAVRINARFYLAQRAGRLSLK